MLNEYELKIRACDRGTCAFWLYRVCVCVCSNWVKIIIDDSEGADYSRRFSQPQLHSHTLRAEDTYKQTCRPIDWQVDGRSDTRAESDCDQICLFSQIKGRGGTKAGPSGVWSSDKEQLCSFWRSQSHVEAKSPLNNTWPDIKGQPDLCIWWEDSQ